jgi:hypothetical protein
MNTSPEAPPTADMARSPCAPSLNLRTGQFFSDMASGPFRCAKLAGVIIATAIHATHNSAELQIENLRVHPDFIGAYSPSLGS